MNYKSYILLVAIISLTNNFSYGYEYSFDFNFDNSLIFNDDINNDININNTVDLDVKRYMGKWYEQIRSKHIIFEDHCFCNTAEYNFNEKENNVKVINKCNKLGPHGRLDTSEGKAVIPYKEYPGYLLVSFDNTILNIPAPYSVLDTDYENYAIVSSNIKLLFLNFNKVWILTRERYINGTYLNHLMNKTADYGYPRVNLMKTFQSSLCDNNYNNLDEELDYNPFMWI